jgi:hypothetical protein
LRAAAAGGRAVLAVSSRLGDRVVLGHTKHVRRAAEQFRSNLVNVVRVRQILIGRLSLLLLLRVVPNSARGPILGLAFLPQTHPGSASFRAQHKKMAEAGRRSSSIFPALESRSIYVLWDTRLVYISWELPAAQYLKRYASPSY